MACTGCTHLVALYWLMVFIHETHVAPSSGKVKTKRHLFSYLVLAGSECSPMCQLLQTGTNYHIIYNWLVLVAHIFWHYIDWWCLFMKHKWCFELVLFANIFWHYIAWWCLLVKTDMLETKRQQKYHNALSWSYLHSFSGNDTQAWKYKGISWHSCTLCVLPNVLVAWQTKNKKTSVVILGSCRSCVLPNVLVAPRRNKLPQYVLWAGPACTHFVPLYCLMVFICESPCGAIQFQAKN